MAQKVLELWLNEKHTVKWQDWKKDQFEKKLKDILENKIHQLDLTGKFFLF